MGQRFNRQGSPVTFHPTGLRLVTGSHRMSLDGNAVSKLSGVDPKEYGVIGRWPGGKAVTSASIGVFFGEYPRQATYLGREGLRNGHVLETTLAETKTIATGSDGSETFQVASTAGFSVGDCVAIYNPTSWAVHNQIVATIKVITGKLITIMWDGVSSGGNAVLSSGFRVVRTPLYWGATINATSPGSIVFAYTSAGSDYDPLPMDIRNGSKVHLVSSYDGSSTLDTLTVGSITATTTSMTITFLEAITSGHVASSFALAPVVEDFSRIETMISMSDGGVWQLYNKTYTDYSSTFGGTTPWSFVHVGNRTFATSGSKDPVSITESGYFVRLGFPVVTKTASTERIYVEKITGRDPTLTDEATASTGLHRIMFRFVDKSVYPYCYSPMIGEQYITASTSTAAIGHIDVFTLFKWIYASGLADRFCRATDWEMFVAPGGSGTLFKHAWGHVSRLFGVCYNSTTLAYNIQIPGNGTWYATKTTPFLTMNDQDIMNGDSIDLAVDKAKGQVPAGKYIGYVQGLLMVAGRTSASYTGEHPRVTSDNHLHLSRTDTDEPENFPEDIPPVQVGSFGDRIKAIVSAGKMGVVLTEKSYSIVQRIGTYLMVDDFGVPGYGLSYNDAYCFTGTHVVWVGGDSVWMLDTQNPMAPQDVGWDIQDWIRGLGDNAANLVRVGYEPTKRLLYVSKMRVGSSPVSEMMAYSLDDKSWVKVEDQNCSAFFLATGVESTTVGVPNLYRLALGYNSGGGNPYAITLYRVRDDDTVKTTCVTSGGWDPKTYVLTGTGTTTDGVTLTSSGTFSGTTQLTITNCGANHPAKDNGLGGCVIRFGDASETVRVIYSSSIGGTTATITWQGAVSVAAGTRWTIGAIPFRMRFPVVRGRDPFEAKVAKGVMLMPGAVSGASEVTPAALTGGLNVRLLRNGASAPAGSTASGTISVMTTSVTTSSATDVDRTVDVECNGKTVELELEDLTWHRYFQILYAQVKVTSLGVYMEDRSDSV